MCKRPGIRYQIWYRLLNCCSIKTCPFGIRQKLTWILSISGKSVSIFRASCILWGNERARISYGVFCALSLSARQKLHVYLQTIKAFGSNYNILLQSRREPQYIFKVSYIFVGGARRAHFSNISSDKLLRAHTHPWLQQISKNQQRLTVIFSLSRPQQTANKRYIALFIQLQ